MDLLANLLSTARGDGCSDVFLKDDYPVLVRAGGRLQPMEGWSESGPVLDALQARLGTPAELQDFDASLVLEDGTRYRANTYRTLGKRGAVLRLIHTEIPALETLGLPAELLASWVQRRAGLILVSGPAGAGKSTTLAALLDWLNQHLPLHVVTIEDPVEYVFTPRACHFSQREIGVDTEDFPTGMRQAMRQSPDVILLGEIRDAHSAKTALQAAESGHLVLATLHSTSSVEALERFLHFFPPSDAGSIQPLLGAVLAGSFCQRLVPGPDGALHVVADYFENQALARKYVALGQWKDLADYIAKPGSEQHRSFMNSLITLCKQGILAEEEAVKHVPNAQEFHRAMQGITGGAGRL